MTTKLVWKNPNAIVSCEWLHNNLNNPDIRIYDCTTYLHYKDNDPSLPYIVAVSYTQLTLPTKA